MRLTIWCNANLAPDAKAELEAALASHQLLWADRGTSNLAAGAPDPQLTQADIAFGQPDPQQILDLLDLKWIQLTSAGYTRYDRDDLKRELRSRGATLTSSSSVYDEPCAQHLLAFMLASARQLPQAAAAQAKGEGWVYDRLRGEARVLRNETVLILGYGAIGRRLAELLQPFKVKVIAVRRTVQGDEAVPTYPISELEHLLPGVDHVANALPANASTAHLIDRHRLSLMKRGACLYNVGRGTTVDQEALLHALATGHVRCAYLDVTDPEPLPPDDPLWTAPNCFITPHIAGGQAEESCAMVHHFLKNLSRFEAGEPLLDRVF